MLFLYKCLDILHIFFDPMTELKKLRKNISIGDYVYVCTNNNKCLVGQIVEIDNENQKAFVKFSPSYVLYTYIELKELNLVL
jgi:hypothetical protein